MNDLQGRAPTPAINPKTNGSLLSFARGFLHGSFLGLALLCAGLVGWVVAILVGAEKDKSLRDLPLMSFYVLSFGLAGGAFRFLGGNYHKWRESIVAALLAGMILIIGCAILAFLSESDRPVEAWWSYVSGAVLLMLFVAAATLRKRAGLRSGQIKE